ncbi:MAG TPA: DNA translocase FtsK 4TM domain-containing protein, partial [Bryobacteraceae bacterium]|nr:DNA translocase FtsK 4TM domain-containing protein [Bryobacteraceae bacterium]
MNEAGGLVFLFAGVFVILCLISYHPEDPSWNLVTGAAHAHNLTGLAGSYAADLCFQLLGLSAFSLPVLLWMLAWKWIRSDAIPAATMKMIGSVVLFLSISTALSIRPFWRPWSGAFSAGGVVGILIADSLLGSLNLIGTVLLTGICLILSLYLISKFSMATVAKWSAGPLSFLARIYERWANWRAQRMALARERAEQRAISRAAKRAERAAREPAPEPEAPPVPIYDPEPMQAAAPVEEPVVPQEIPIHTLEYESSRPPWEAPAPPPEPEPKAVRKRESKKLAPEMTDHPAYRVPSTDLLNEVPARNPFDSLELKEIASRIKSKFEEFNVHGAVVQINPGPVVT